MVRSAILLLTIVCLCICPALSRINKNDLEAAVSAFDGYVDKAKKIEAEPTVNEADAHILEQTEAEPTVYEVDTHTSQQTEAVPTVYEVDTHTVQQNEAEPTVYEVDTHTVQQTEATVEEVFVKKEALCTGCPYNLNITSPNIIEFATESLGLIDDGSTNTYSKLVKATAQVQNVPVYNLKVEVNRCIDGSCSNATCILELKNINNRIELTYYRCIDV